MNKSSQDQLNTSDSSDPRPAATEAAIRETVETIINESVWHEYGGDEDDELFIGAIVRERIELAGITFAAAPPSGQVCVDREDLYAAIVACANCIVELPTGGYDWLSVADRFDAALTEGADR